MSIIQALILGALQGLTEFLPISSSGHLLIAEKLMNITASADDMLLLNVLLHVGTLVAVVCVYWKRLINMLLHPFKSELKWLIVATLPTVAAALIVDFSDAFEGKFIIWSFYLTSAVLTVGTIVGRKRRKNHSTHKKVRFMDAISTGLMQAVAVLPGLSRSGSTLTGGVASGLTRKRAADFAFLMSVPAICGSAILELKDFLDVSERSLSIGALPIVVGILAAALFGFAAIRFFLKLVRKSGMTVFAIYTFALGSFLLANKYIFKWIELF